MTEQSRKSENAIFLGSRPRMAGLRWAQVFMVLVFLLTEAGTLAPEVLAEPAAGSFKPPPLSVALLRHGDRHSELDDLVLAAARADDPDTLSAEEIADEIAAGTKLGQVAKEASTDPELWLYRTIKALVALRAFGTTEQVARPELRTIFAWGLEPRVFDEDLWRLIRDVATNAEAAAIPAESDFNIFRRDAERAAARWIETHADTDLLLLGLANPAPTIHLGAQAGLKRIAPAGSAEAARLFALIGVEAREPVRIGLETVAGAIHDPRAAVPLFRRIEANATPAETAIAWKALADIFVAGPDQLLDHLLGTDPHLAAKALPAILGFVFEQQRATPEWKRDSDIAIADLLAAIDARIASGPDPGTRAALVETLGAVPTDGAFNLLMRLLDTAITSDLPEVGRALLRNYKALVGRSLNGYLRTVRCDQIGAALAAKYAALHDLTGGAGDSDAICDKLRLISLSGAVGAPEALTKAPKLEFDDPNERDLYRRSLEAEQDAHADALRRAAAARAATLELLVAIDSPGFGPLPPCALVWGVRLANARSANQGEEGRREMELGRRILQSFLTQPVNDRLDAFAKDITLWILSELADLRVPGSTSTAVQKVTKAINHVPADRRHQDQATRLWEGKPSSRDDDDPEWWRTGARTQSSSEPTLDRVHRHLQDGDDARTLDHLIEGLDIKSFAGTLVLFVLVTQARAGAAPEATAFVREILRSTEGPKIIALLVSLLREVTGNWAPVEKLVAKRIHQTTLARDLVASMDPAGFSLDDLYTQLPTDLTTFEVLGPDQVRRLDIKPGALGLDPVSDLLKEPANRARTPTWQALIGCAWDHNSWAWTLSRILWTREYTVRTRAAWDSLMKMRERCGAMEDQVRRTSKVVSYAVNPRTGSTRTGSKDPGVLRETLTANCTPASRVSGRCTTGVGRLVAGGADDGGALRAALLDMGLVCVPPGEGECPNGARIDDCVAPEGSAVACARIEDPGKVADLERCNAETDRFEHVDVPAAEAPEPPAPDPRVLRALDEARRERDDGRRDRILARLEARLDRYRHVGSAVGDRTLDLATLTGWTPDEIDELHRVSPDNDPGSFADMLAKAWGLLGDDAVDDAEAGPTRRERAHAKALKEFTDLLRSTNSSEGERRRIGQAIDIVVAVLFEVDRTGLHTLRPTVRRAVEHRVSRILADPVLTDHLHRIAGILGLDLRPERLVWDRLNQVMEECEVYPDRGPVENALMSILLDPYRRASFASLLRRMLDQEGEGFRNHLARRLGLVPDGKGGFEVPELEWVAQGFHGDRTTDVVQAAVASIETQVVRGIAARPAVRAALADEDRLKELEDAADHRARVEDLVERVIEAAGTLCGSPAPEFGDLIRNLVGMIGEPASVRVFGNMLVSKTEALAKRVKAARALGLLPTTEARRYIDKLVQDSDCEDDKDLIAEALAALGRMGERDAREQLRQYFLAYCGPTQTAAAAVLCDGRRTGAGAADGAHPTADEACGFLHAQGHASRTRPCPPYASARSYVP